MKNRRVAFNAVTTVAQVVANAAVLFFLYRFLIRNIGIEKLGIWSLLLATTSLAMLANQGLSMSIVRFVAKYSGRESERDVSLLIQTALVTAAVGVGLVCLLLYPAARWALGLILPPANLGEAVALLPFALVSLWLNVLGMIAQAGLTGRQMIAHCNAIEFGASLLYLFLAFYLVPARGLMGLAIAQAMQSTLALFAAWCLLRRSIPRLTTLPLRWSCAHCSEMIAYGTHFQWITICQSLREPVTKALLTKFAGLSYTGLYDLAARYVVTLREGVVQSNQTLVPVIASSAEHEPGSTARIYRSSYRLILFIAVPSFALLVVASPLVSTLWIGRREPVFIVFVALLAFGWLINVLCNPAYVFDLATGSLHWVSIGCAVTALLNTGLGFLAGRFFGPTATVAAAVISLSVGYLMILIAHHSQTHESFRILLPSESRVVLTLSAIGVFVLLPLAYFLGAHLIQPLMSTAAAALFAAIMLGVAMWTHPIRRRLFQWLAAGMP